MTNLAIRETAFDDIAALHNRIPEFTAADAAFFQQRCAGKTTLPLIALYNERPAGYAVAYDRYNDGSLYIWMVGIVPEYRQLGIYSALAAHIENWSRENGFTALRIKTRNNRREMLSWLVKNNFDFTKVDKAEPMADSRIHLIKKLHK